jgi:RNA polymerase sigma factor (sigma-70 family)
VLPHHTTAYLQAVAAERQRKAARRRTGAAHAGLSGVVLAAAARDAGAWCTLVEQFTARLRGVARAHRLASHDADDVVQTAWLRLLEHIESIRDPDAVGAWLEVTATRESRRLLRGGKREMPAPPESLDEPAIAPVDEQRLAAAECRTALDRALDRLSTGQELLLRVLLADDGPSYAEISAQLEIPIGGIGPTRARGIERLRSDEALMTTLGDSRDALTELRSTA